MDDLHLGDVQKPDNVVGQLRDKERDRNDEGHTRHRSSRSLDSGLRSGSKQTVKTDPERRVGCHYEQEREEEAEGKLRPSPRLQHRYAARLRYDHAAAGAIPSNRNHLAVYPVGSRHDNEAAPDDAADHLSNGHRAELAGVIEAGQVAVEGEGDQREDADVLVALADGVGQLADEATEDPVAGEGRVAEEDEGHDEEEVGDGQVQYVVIGDGFSADLRMTPDDVDDESVAKATEDEREQVGDEDGSAHV